MYNDFWVGLGCFLVFVGFNLTFFPQFVMGARGMPRRYARYDPEFQIFHQVSTVGAFVLGFGVLLAFAVLVYAAFRGRKVGGNPFGAASLEWQSSSPPSFHNFDHKIILNDPYDFDAIVWDADLQTWVQREFVAPQEIPVAPDTVPASGGQN